MTNLGAFLLYLARLLWLIGFTARDILKKSLAKCTEPSNARGYLSAGSWGPGVGVGGGGVGKGVHPRRLPPSKRRSGAESWTGVTRHVLAGTWV